ncbi:hypothetical protein DFJ73DRAFT_415333 [Zopfochytrium polystomum]|nr:hypothetical protein DFJ73DRAFT_415333 [Zopfochytrium polystomum]
MAPTSSGPLNPVNTSRLWPRATHTTDTVNFDQLVQLTEEVREHASTRVQHQDFMSKFFAMFYHYPESRFPKGPWTLDGPVPSSEDYVPDASTVRLRAGRIANLSLPRRIEVAAIRGESKPAKLDGAGRSGDSVRGPKSKRADDMAVAVESPCRTARQGAGKDIMPRLPPYYLRKPPIIGQSCEGEKLSVPHQKQDQLGGIILPETAESNNRGGRIATKVAMRTLLRRTTSAGLRGESGENRIIKVDVTMGDVVNSTVAKEGRRADAQVLTDELNLQFGHTWERQILKSKKPLDNRNMQCRISSGKPTRQSVLKTSLMVNPNDKNGLKNRNVGAPSNESGGIEGPGASFGFENGDGLHNQDPRPLETSGGRPSSRATRASSSSPIRATRRTMSANPGEPKKDSRVGPTLEIMDGVLETATIEHDGEAHKKTTEPTEATTNSLPHEVRIGADDNGQTSKDEGGDNKIVQQKIGAVDAAHVPTNSAQSMDDLIGPGGSAFFRRHFNKLLEVLQKDDWNRSEEERQFIETCLKSLPAISSGTPPVPK